MKGGWVGESVGEFEMLGDSSVQVQGYDAYIGKDTYY
jgi:hypothetical protein